MRFYNVILKIRSKINVMKPILTLLFIISISYSNLLAQYDGDALFNKDSIHEIRINTDKSLVELYNQFNLDFGTGAYTYCLSSIEIDGELIDSVGVRVKGGLTAFDLKKPLKIDFNEFVTGQKYDGLKKLNLHQGNMDPSYMREVISYDLFRKMGVKTVRTSYVHVYYNDVYEGIYTLVEQIDDDFIYDHFASDKGILYKTGFAGLDVKFDNVNTLYFEDFMVAVNALPNDSLHIYLKDYIDIEAFMRFVAMQVFVNESDGPLVTDINYYLYYEPKSMQYSYIPWDYNSAFYSNKDFSVLPTTSNFLFNKLISNSILRDRYLTTYCTLLQTSLLDDSITEMIDDYSGLLEDEVINDPYISMIGDFESSVTNLKQYIENRRATIFAELESLIGSCQDFNSPLIVGDLVINEFMASNNSLSTISDPNGGYPDWIELYNNSNQSISLENIYLSNDLDFTKHWRFPKDLSIGAGEYLIVWADRDLEEEGLHTSFKLNKDRGAIYLSDESGIMLDSVSYRDQETNISFARMPNGVGEFRAEEPTHGESNDLVATDDINAEIRSFVCYPNPSDGKVNLSIETVQNRDYQLELISALGTIMYRDHVKLLTGNNKIYLDLAGQSKGQYQLVLKDKNGVVNYSSSLIIAN